MAIQTFTLTDQDSPEALQFEISNLDSAVNQQFGLNDTRVTVTYKIPWSRRYLARKLLLGHSVRRTKGAVPFIHRTLPHKWIEPGTTELPDLYCTRITNTRGHGTKHEPTCYAEALITCEYSHLPYLIRPDDEIAGTVSGQVVPDESQYNTALGNFVRFVERMPPQSEGRIITMHGKGWVFCDATNTSVQDSRPVTNGAPFPYFEQTLSWTWHTVPEEAVPWTTLDAAINKLNNAVFAGYAVYTLMFVGYEPVLVRQPDGGRAWNIRLKFKHNPNGWDTLPDPLLPRPGGLPRWFRVVAKNGSTSDIIFGETNFASLLRPA